MTQSQVKISTALFCDLKTDEEKSTFFLMGRGYETGVIAPAIQNDVAMAYHCCSEYRKQIEALQAECEKLRKDAGLWESIHDEIHRRADKEHALADRCDFDVTIMYEDYAAIDAAMETTK